MKYLIIIGLTLLFVNLIYCFSSKDQLELDNLEDDNKRSMNYLQESFNPMDVFNYVMNSFQALISAISSNVNFIINGVNRRRPQHPATEAPDLTTPNDSNSILDDINKGITSQSITVEDCGLSNMPKPRDLIDDRIVNGKEAEKGQFPWQIILKIVMPGNKTYLCGGSILNEHWVLTAGHCVTNARDGSLQNGMVVEATAGAHYRKELSATQTQTRTADCVIPHPCWRGNDGNLANDLALLRIPKNNPYKMTYKSGGNVNGICLPKKQSPPYQHEGIAWVSGWGLSKSGNSPDNSPPNALRYTNVTIISDRQCRDWPLSPFGSIIIDSMMCQKNDRRSPCNGDSGGPLIYYPDDRRATQIGIVSFGPGQCAIAYWPNAVYTEVSYFNDWIDSTVRKYDGDAQCPNLRNTCSRSGQKPPSINLGK